MLSLDSVHIRATFHDGVLDPTERLTLRQGEKVRLIVQREPDPARWNLERHRSTAAEDRDLAEAGVAAWADALDALDHR
jgi:predicted DNA-binding antitoxin AbrB/MazE fold protein